MKICQHTYGINRDGYGNDEWITDPNHPLMNKEDTDLFTCCPDCGELLIPQNAGEVE